MTAGKTVQMYRLTMHKRICEFKGFRLPLVDQNRTALRLDKGRKERLQMTNADKDVMRFVLSDGVQKLYLWVIMKMKIILQ